MIRNFATLLTCFTLGLTGTARAECTGTDQLLGADPAILQRLETEAAAQPFPNGRYWEVEKNGRSSVIFGTFHSPDADIAVVPDALASRIEAARVLYVEMTYAEEQRMQRAMILNPSLMLNADGRSIRPYFSENEWDMLRGAMARIGHSPESVEVMQPWFLSMALAVPPCLIEAQINGDLVLDRLIERNAEDAGVDVGGLEEYEAVLDIFRDGSFEEQVEALRQSLPMIGGNQDALVTMKRLYLQGDIWQIWAYNSLLAEEHLSPEEVETMMAEMHEIVVRGRNHDWMRRILPEVTRGNAVIAVGALHLPGEDGLLNLLAQQGFETRPLDE